MASSSSHDSAQENNEWLYSDEELKRILTSGDSREDQLETMGFDAATVLYRLMYTAMDERVKVTAARDLMHESGIGRQRELTIKVELPTRQLEMLDRVFREDRILNPASDVIDIEVEDGIDGDQGN